MLVHVKSSQANQFLLEVDAPTTQFSELLSLACATHSLRIRLVALLNSIKDRIPENVNKQELFCACATAATACSIEQVNAKAAGVVSLESIQTMIAQIQSLIGTTQLPPANEELQAEDATAWLIGKQREADKTLAELVGKGTLKAVVVIAKGVTYDKAASAPKIGQDLDGAAL